MPNNKSVVPGILILSTILMLAGVLALPREAYGAGLMAFGVFFVVLARMAQAAGR